MKKILIIALALALVFAVGCTDEKNGSETTDSAELTEDVSEKADDKTDEADVTADTDPVDPVDPVGSDTDDPGKQTDAPQSGAEIETKTPDTPEPFIPDNVDSVPPDIFDPVIGTPETKAPESSGGKNETPGSGAVTDAVTTSSGIELPIIPLP